MQIRLFTIPILGGEQLTEDLNVFLRSRKILQTENHIVTTEQGAYWCFCVKYLETNNTKIAKSTNRKERIDYKEVLDAESFQRFSEMRVIRKAIAQEEAIPAYAVFTDAELAGLAQIKEDLSLAKMRTVKGIGEKKVEKYGSRFLKNTSDDKSK